MSRSIRKGPATKRCPAPLLSLTSPLVVDTKCSAVAPLQLICYNPHRVCTAPCKMTPDLRLESVEWALFSCLAEVLNGRVVSVRESLFTSGLTRVDGPSLGWRNFTRNLLLFDVGKGHDWSMRGKPTAGCRH